MLRAGRGARLLSTAARANVASLDAAFNARDNAATASQLQALWMLLRSSNPVGDTADAHTPALPRRSPAEATAEMAYDTAFSGVGLMRRASVASRLDDATARAATFDEEPRGPTQSVRGFVVAH